MPSRVYVNTATPTSLTAGITNVATTISVASKVGWPTSFPFTVTVEKNVTGQGEAMEVTASPNGTDYTVTRGIDGTGAVAHPPGALVSHDHTARDYTEWQAVRDHQIMRPGASSLYMKTTLPVVSVAATTAYNIFTVPAGRKYVVKTAVISNSGSSSTVATLGTATAANNLVPGTIVSATSTLHLDVATVFNAGDTLTFSTVEGGSVASATISYIDLPATDAPFRAAIGQITSSATWTTVYTASSNVVLTSMMFGNATSATAGQYAYRVGSSGQAISGQNAIPARNSHFIDSPIYMATGEVLQVWAQTLDTIRYHASGLTVGSL